MGYPDYPHTFAELRKILPSIDRIRPSHGATIAAINTLRKDLGMDALSVDELIMATLGRIEDKLKTPEPQITITEEEVEETQH